MKPGREKKVLFCLLPGVHLRTVPQMDQEILKCCGEEIGVQVSAPVSRHLIPNVSEGYLPTFQRDFASKTICERLVADSIGSEGNFEAMYCLGLTCFER